MNNINAKNNNLKSVLDYFKYLDNHLKEMTPPGISCGECYKCCRYPYFYMTLHEPESFLIEEYLRQNNIPIRVHFEPMTTARLDKRVYYKNWVCPFYRGSVGGCIIYPVRPFSCRIYGTYRGQWGKIEGCVYEDPVVFDSVEDLPVWEEYMKMLRNFDTARHGYIFPDSMLYEMPSLEFLMEEEYPWSYSKNYVVGWNRGYVPMLLDQINDRLVMSFLND